MPSRDVTQRVRERIRWAWQLRFGERGAQFAVLAGILLVVLGVGVFIGVLDAVREVDDIAALDEPVLRALTSVRSPVATAVLTAITTVAGPVVLPVVVLVGALVWALVGKARWQASLLAGAMVVCTAVSLTVKAVVARPRPPLGTMTAAGVQSTYSFPSGHTIRTATFLLVLGSLVWVRRPRLRSPHPHQVAEHQQERCGADGVPGGERVGALHPGGGHGAQRGPRSGHHRLDRERYGGGDHHRPGQQARLPLRLADERPDQRPDQHDDGQHDRSGDCGDGREHRRGNW